MKPYIYKIYALLFIITFKGYSQSKEVVLNESFTADDNTVLSLDLDNVSIILEQSLDNKIHFDYTITFGRYSKRKREIILKQSKVKFLKKNNLVNLNVKNSAFLGINTRYMLDFNSDNYLIPFKDYVKFEKSKKDDYKTKNSILKEIEDSNLTKVMKKNIKNYQNNESIKDKKVIIKKFVIKVPKNIKIRIKAIQSDINFNYDITEPLFVNSFKGVFKFKKIIGKENRIISSNGIFQAEKVMGARLEFLDMRKVVIGDISNVNLVSETSKIQIGEIGKNVIFNDFNSKINLYNYGENFTNFNLIGNYTNLNLYNVKESNYSMNINGFNTTLNMDDYKTTFGDSKDKILTKILEKKPKENIVSNGNIAIELKNGILSIK